MFLALDKMQNLFEMLPRIALIRLQSCGVFAHLLVFEVKGELTMPRLYKLVWRPADSWYIFPDISELCLQQKAWCMAQDKQFNIKHALSK